MTFTGKLSSLLALALLLSACQLNTSQRTPSATPFQPLAPTAITEISPTAVPSVTETPIATPTNTTEPTATPAPALWIDPLVPSTLAEAVQQAVGYPLSDDPQSLLQFGPVPNDEASSEWIFALGAAFSTITDDVRSVDLLSAWGGQPAGPFEGRSLLAPVEYRELLVFLLGEPVGGIVQFMPGEQLLSAAWDTGAFAIVSFEQLEPRWKVIHIDGVNPLDKSSFETAYLLAVPFGLTGESLDVAAIPPGNRDPGKLTTLVMTGVTALVRATAYQMEVSGINFPARDIGSWLSSADVTHISNEVSFYEDCPEPNPAPGPLYFCSQPEYFELFQTVGADVIELTGNHNNDSAEVYGVDVVPYNLDLYRQNGMLPYAGGQNEAEARQPAMVEHNGNKLAFIGCNPAGPEYAWAYENSPGAASCGDFEWLKAEVARLRGEGYLPITTFQWFENYSNAASPDMEIIFREMANAGAILVQGSQAHTPKELEFTSSGALLHYGLGNLFFDQMYVDLSFLQVGYEYIPYTRFEFIDRHTIYGGRLISTELLTAVLEDYARPRPATIEERNAFLSDIFTASGWRVWP